MEWVAKHTLACIIRFYNGTAGYFASGITRRLAAEIIGLAVDDDRPADNFINAETFVIKGRPGVPLIA